MKISDINIVKFIIFAKKSLDISDGVFFTIDLKNKRFTASPYTKTRQVLMVVDEPLDSYFKTIKADKGEEIPDEIKIGISSATINKVLDIAGKSEKLKLTINTYEEENFKNLARLVRFYDSDFRIEKKCIHPTIPFIQIDSDKISSIMDSSDSDATFTITSSTITKLKRDFFVLDDVVNYTIVTFVNHKGELHVKGETWSYKIDGVTLDPDIELDFKFSKSYFNFLDSKPNSYELSLVNDKMIIKDPITNIALVFARYY